MLQIYVTSIYFETYNISNIKSSKVLHWKFDKVAECKYLSGVFGKFENCRIEKFKFVGVFFFKLCFSFFSNPTDVIIQLNTFFWMKYNENNTIKNETKEISNKSNK